MVPLIRIFQCPCVGAPCIGVVGWHIGSYRLSEGVCVFGWVEAFEGVVESLEIGGVGKKKVRFYVEGVTDRGVVLRWERCAYAEMDLDLDV